MKLYENVFEANTDDKVEVTKDYFIEEIDFKELEERMMEFETEREEMDSEDRPILLGNDQIAYVKDVRVDLYGTGYSVRQGTIYLYDEDSDEYEADYSVTFIYLEGEKNLRNFLYFEQDDIYVSLRNYLGSNFHDFIRKVHRCGIYIEDAIADDSWNAGNTSGVA